MCIRDSIQQPLNVEVTIAALNALNQIASHGQVFKNALSSLGVLQLVSSHHSLNPSPSHLRSVTVHKSRLYLAMGVVCDTTRGLALELGLVSSTIMFMCDFPHEPELQQAGCALLANLACGSDLGKQQVVDEGGIELVVQAMHHHARHALLQRFSCMVLSNIHTVNSATRMLEAGVVESTRKAMQHFESNHELWEASAKLLYRMVSRAQLRAEEMLQAQRENAAMTQHDPYPSPSSSPDQQCQLIIPSDQTRQAQLDSDIMEVVVARNFDLCPVHPDIRSIACRWLPKLQAATKHVYRQPWSRESHQGGVRPTILCNKAMAIILSLNQQLTMMFDLYDPIIEALDATQCRTL
eukprot:TRINITY_DN17941_c0_g1_i8.p1 TRINITY_DN17941_c0_g1~~TRINITY_DN17941_c0_g1_i8.p1  ORF type:complete len:352 (+),score=59.91 TRINITY_DN17941_c0_g1_i8:171-1226(+)